MQDSYKCFAVLEGHVITPGMDINFAPIMLTAEVKFVQMHYEVLPEATPVENVSFNLQNISILDFKRGTGHSASVT